MQELWDVRRLFLPAVSHRFWRAGLLMLREAPSPSPFLLLQCVLLFDSCVVLFRPLAAGMVVTRVCDSGVLGGSVKSKSFVDALAGSSTHGGFPELKPSTFHGIPSLWILDDEILALAAPFDLRWWVFFHHIVLFFFNLKLIAEFSVTLLDSSHVLIKLSNDLDYSKVFCH
ncbi:hypothetical protein M5K25_016975 [Dendrobium thyrsiflorum]|uniref:Uncharacterized protein n=1 Tax=Dendrobium thyrsiflorum TaxID=117978 RepID=A0ABD0UL57_DENTH